MSSYMANTGEATISSRWEGGSEAARAINEGAVKIIIDIIYGVCHRPGTVQTFYVYSSSLNNIVSFNIVSL